jgi:hypothetical protein
MKRLTNTKHLFFSERLSRCSDPAQLHHARLMLCCNTACRSELSPDVIRRTAYATMRVQPTDDELFAWWAEYFEHHLLFIYTDPATGALWGEWLIPDEYKPSYPYAEDKRTPAPDLVAIEAYRRSYYDAKKRKSQKALNISELSESVPSVEKCSEVSELSESVPLVVVGVVVEDKDSLSSSGDDAVSESFPSSKAENPNGKISASATDLDEFVHRWNTRVGATLQPVRRLGKARMARLKACIRENDLTLTRWDRALDKLLATPFCTGKGPNEWRASFDWLITADNLDRVVEGQFGKPEKPKREFREMPDFDDSVKYGDHAWLATQCRNKGPAETKAFFDRCRAQMESMPEPQRTKELRQLETDEQFAKEFFEREALKANGGRHANA